MKKKANKERNLLKNCINAIIINYNEEIRRNNSNKKVASLTRYDLVFETV